MNINELIAKRRTVRKFKQTALSEALLDKYVAAARVAPSAANLQPLKYVTVSGKEMTDKVFPLLRWAGYLKGEYNPKEDERPTAYIAVCVDHLISKAKYDMDVGAAVENIILSALDDGVGTCWLGSVDYPKLTKLLALPENIEITCVVALGYPAEEPKEAVMQDGDVKYYLKDGVLNVPKRKTEDIVIKRF